jgi:ketosteroid isomerase-like protein
MTDAQREVWEIVREANKARVAAATRELTALHEPDAVLVRSSLEERLEGRDAIVRAVEEESHQERIEAFEELEHSIDVFGDFALVAYRYEMRTRPAGADEEEEGSGLEVVALRRSAGRWKVLWRTQVAE